MIDYNKFDCPMPYAVVQGFLYSIKLDAFLTLWRLSNIRSAGNCRSLVAGLHDVGETMPMSMARECLEEVNLSVNPGEIVHVGCYESLGTEQDQWHWIHQVMFVPLISGEEIKLKNMEPEKHRSLTWTQSDVLGFEGLRWSHVLSIMEFHPTFSRWLTEHRFKLLEQICRVRG